MYENPTSKFPWEPLILTKDLLLQLIKNSDETEKIDFKLDINIHGPKLEKNELLLDIACIANSYSSEHDNHGFLIFDIDPLDHQIKGTDVSKENLKTHIDDLMFTYLSPHIRFCVEIYDIEGSDKKWGAIIIRPGVEMPHVLTKDSGGFNKGEIWVRRGSRKCPADHSDFSRFYAIRTEFLKRDLDQLEAKMNLQEYDLKKKIENLEKKIESSTLSTNNPIKKSTSKGRQNKAKVIHEQVQEQTTTPTEISKNYENKNLLSLVKKELPKHSPLEASLLKEVRAGNIFLESDEISWQLRISEGNKEEALEVLQRIQGQFETYYKALFELAFFGNKAEHHAIILNSVQKLARYIDRSGVPYEALYVRYLPLVTTLHIISMASVYRQDSALIKKVTDLDLYRKERQPNKHPITDCLFMIRSATEIFDALNPGYPKNRWCDGVGTYLKQFFSATLSSYDEFQDSEALFYQGEFLLSLMPIITKSESDRSVGHISSGSYIFYSEASYVIEQFLKKNKPLLEDIFGKDLRKVLENFDEYAPKMGNGGGCWSDGVPESATEIIFPKAKIIES